MLAHLVMTAGEMRLFCFGWQIHWFIVLRGTWLIITSLFIVVKRSPSGFFFEWLYFHICHANCSVLRDVGKEEQSLCFSKLFFLSSQHFENVFILIKASWLGGFWRRFLLIVQKLIGLWVLSIVRQTKAMSLWQRFFTEPLTRDNQFFH